MALGEGGALDCSGWAASDVEAPIIAKCLRERDLPRVSQPESILIRQCGGRVDERSRQEWCIVWDWYVSIRLAPALQDFVIPDVVDCREGERNIVRSTVAAIVDRSV